MRKAIRSVEPRVVVCGWKPPILLVLPGVLLFKQLRVRVELNQVRDLFVEFFAAYDVGPGGLPGLYYRAVRA